MASGSQNMTTYNARTVTGSNSAASPAGALLLSGAGRAGDATGDTWIFLDSRGGTSTPWGIKHDQVNNKIQIFGAGINSVWTEMNTGHTYIGGSLNTGSTLTVRAQDSTHEGGEIVLNPATDSFSTVHIDAYDSMFRLHDGTNERFKVNVSSGNTTINGNLGIGADYAVLGGSYKLYVNGSSYFTNTITGDSLSTWHILGGRPSNTTNFDAYFETVDNLHHDNPARTDVELTYNRFFLSHSDQTTYGPSALHLPVVDQHVLSFGIDNSAAYSRHMAFDIRTNAVYVRARTNNTWGNWEQLVRNTGTWGISITGNAASATNAANTQSGYGAKKITVGGNANTYYPVLITNHTSHYAWTLLNITRGYSEPAPDTWYTNTHRGGLTLTILSNGDTAWGGNHHIGTSKLNCIIDLSEEYTTMVGGVYVTTSGLLVLLRGGNADYWITSNNGQAVNAFITLGTFTASNNATFAARTSPDTANINAMRWNNLWTVANATSAIKATQDGNGNTITSKYVTIDTAQTITGNKSWGSGGAGGILYGNATNGGINSMRIGDDVYLGDCNASGIMGMKSTGANCGFYFYNSSGTQIGQLYANGTGIYCNKTLQIHPTSGNYTEGIRIYPNGGWTTIMLLSNGTSTEGVASNDWGIFNNNGTLYINKGNSSGAGNPRVYANANGWYFTKAYGAVWNDFAEYRKVDIHEPGYAIAPSGIRTSQRLESGARITSDTYGYAIGYMENRKDLMPVAIAGRVLAYPLHDKSYYEVGDAVCAAEGGKIDKMTRDEIKEYPDRIIGIVNEIPDYDIWEPSREGGGREPIHTNGRIWIDVR